MRFARSARASNRSLPGPGYRLTHALDGTRGMFDAQQVRDAIRPINRHQPRSRLLSVENTSNLGGGAVWPLDQINEVTEAAREFGLRTHMDGARLMNAVVASGHSPAAFAEPFDSAWLDLSKGLGAPVGGVLTGSAEFIDQAWRFKHQFGGAMRQSGIIAAGGIYALENHVERLADDHANARRLAQDLSQIPGIEIDPDKIDTNMVFFDVRETGLGAPEISSRVLEQGVRIGAINPTTMRAVTHIDVDEEGVRLAGAAVRKALNA